MWGRAILKEDDVNTSLKLWEVLIF